MIISDKRKIAFIGIPKTGTRSVYRELENNYDGIRHRDHAKKFVSSYRDYYKFTIVRNPYDRLVSSWWSTTQRNEDPKGYIKSTLKDDTSFLNFCRNLEQLRDRHRNVPHVLPQVNWLNNKFDKIIRYESLNEEWLNLPFNLNSIPLPHLNPTTRKAANNPISRKTTESYLNEECIAIINNFYKEDFNALKYDMLN